MRYRRQRQDKIAFAHYRRSLIRFSFQPVVVNSFRVLLQQRNPVYQAGFTERTRSEKGPADEAVTPKRKEGGTVVCLCVTPVTFLSLPHSGLVGGQLIGQAGDC
jgi:hypothetical protein